jgi:hypothetical protein
MSETLPPLRPKLKRQSSPRMAVADPLELFYAGVGYLGVFYESQLIYLKHELDACAAPDPSDHLIPTLQAAQAFVLNLVCQNSGGVPLNQSIRDFIEANRPAVQQLAAEGKELVRRVHEERKVQ